jgi:deazaflavin-dependent oxidoreductase (nitroreductase family)
MQPASDELDQIAAIRTVDLTTIGRKSGTARTVEIWWLRVDGRFVITGTPGRRDWMANVLADPRVRIGVDGRVFEATAAPVHDEAFRRRVFAHPGNRWYSSQAGLDMLVRTAPMIEVVFTAERVVD